MLKNSFNVSLNVNVLEISTYYNVFKVQWLIADTVGAGDCLKNTFLDDY